MLKQYSSEVARQSILRRTPPDEFPVSQRVLDGIVRIFGTPLTPEQAVTRILKDVRTEGDSALHSWTYKLDGLDRQPVPVSKEAIRSALESIPAGRRVALELAARRIEAFHRHQPLTSWFTNELGGTVGQIIRPIQRVGHLLDLRTISPWDRGAVLASVRHTRRCLIVHEDMLTAGFGAEVAAVVAQEAFLTLDAPVRRLAVPDVPTPYNVALMNALLPGVEAIAAAMAELIEF